MGFPGKSINELYLEEEKGDEEEDSLENGDAADEENGIDNGNDEEYSQNGVLDPRAGRVDVVMHEIKFNALEIVNELEDLKYKKFTRVRNRKCIDRIVSTYKKYAEGVFPIGIQKIKVDRDELGVPDIDEKADELIEFEQELYGKQRELKKLNKRKRKKIVSNANLFDEFQAKSNKIARIKNTVNVWTEEDIATEQQTNETITIATTPTKKVKSKHQKDLKKTNSIEADEVTTDETPKSGKKRKTNEWNQPLEDGEIEYVIPSKKNQLNGAPRITITNDSIINTVITPTKSDKSDKSTSNEDSTPIVASTSKPSPLSISIKMDNFTKSIKNKKTNSSKSNTPLNSTGKKAKIMNLTPNALLSSAEKRVKIALKMNQSQEVTEYMKQLKQSPSLPYDSAKKPLKGVLKPNLTPSPINPFYKRLIGMK